jgi:hypothetical protein
MHRRSSRYLAKNKGVAKMVLCEEGQAFQIGARCAFAIHFRRTLPKLALLYPKVKRKGRLSTRMSLSYLAP